MGEIADKLWDEGFFPVVGEPWTLEDHERIRKLRERIKELEGALERIARHFGSAEQCREFASEALKEDGDERQTTE